MRITAIEPFKGEQYHIFVDFEYACSLDIELIMLNHLKMGMEIDEDFLKELDHQAQRRRARERAYYLLGYRDHSKKELYDKLCRNAEPEIAAEIVALMIEQNLLNDEEYAAKVARYGLNSKLWGPQKVYQDMLRRGIDKETALSAIEECEWDAFANLKKLIDKKYYRKLDKSFEGTQKTIAALMRQGYSASDAKLAIELYYEENELE